MYVRIKLSQYYFHCQIHTYTYICTYVGVYHMNVCTYVRTCSTHTSYTHNHHFILTITTLAHLYSLSPHLFIYTHYHHTCSPTLTMTTPTHQTHFHHTHSPHLRTTYDHTHSHTCQSLVGHGYYHWPESPQE